MKYKHYTSNQLQSKATEYFGANEGETVCFITSNGFVFKSENRAYVHAQERNLSVYKYTKTESTPTVVEDTPSFLDGNAATVIAGVKSLKRAEAVSYAAAELDSKNRKSVLKALNDYVEASPTAIAIAPVAEPKAEQSRELVLTFTPDPDGNEKVKTEVYFESSDEEKATVDENGVVTLIDIGEVTIKAIAKYGFVEGSTTFTIDIIQ